MLFWLLSVIIICHQDQTHNLWDRRPSLTNVITLCWWTLWLPLIIVYDLCDIFHIKVMWSLKWKCLEGWYRGICLALRCVVWELTKTVMLRSQSWIALTLWSPLMDSEFITGCYISHFCSAHLESVIIILIPLFLHCLFKTESGK